VSSQQELSSNPAVINVPGAHPGSYFKVLRSSLPGVILPKQKVVVHHDFEISSTIEINPLISKELQHRTNSLLNLLLHTVQERLRCLSRYSDSLRAGRPEIKSRWEARFSAPVHTGLGAHPASYTKGTESFLGVKRPGVALTTNPHLGQRLKKEQSYTSVRPMGLRGLF
jgi:hypothetical protein